MSRRRVKAKLRQRTSLAAGAVALAAVIAMASVNVRNSRQEESQQDEIAQAEEEQEAEPVLSEEMTAQTQENEAAADGEEVTKEVMEQIEATTDAAAVQEVETAETDGQTEETPALTFSDNTTIDWPVQGDILIEYSMDSTVYFETLDQYKCNPAVIIAADVNTKVSAAADATVTDVSTNETTGLTVTVDLGSGYQAVYGQLKEVSWKAGDTMSRGDTVGYIAEPTKYYCQEGSNLYFAMTKDGEAVNPMEYLA